MDDASSRLTHGGRRWPLAGSRRSRRPQEKKLIFFKMNASKSKCTAVFNIIAAALSFSFLNQGINRVGGGHFPIRLPGQLLPLLPATGKV